MMHKAIVQMDPTKLEMLDGFEKTNSGHKYSTHESNVQVIISGRDWSEKRIFVYGCKSTEEAKEYIDHVIGRVDEIDHNIKILEGPEITNIAVSGDLEDSLQLEALTGSNRGGEFEVEYEPEQFPAAIVRMDDCSATVMLFSTGKFVIQGLQNLEDIEPTINRIQRFLELTMDST
jgi:TATA-box binding protein (TBP) (component of TFIID and TFIIIB)